MKKILKYTCAIFLVFTLFTLFNSNIFGYNLKYKAKFNDDSTYECRIRNIVQASDHSNEVYEYAKKMKDTFTYKDVYENINYGTYKLKYENEYVYQYLRKGEEMTGGTSFYDNCGILIGTQINSNYDNKGSYNIYYDTLQDKNEIDIDTVDWKKFNEGGQNVNVGKKEIINMGTTDRDMDNWKKSNEDLIFEYQSEDFFLEKWKLLNLGNIYVGDWKFSNDFIKKILEKYKNDTDFYKNIELRMSLVGVVTNSDNDKLKMPTAYDFYNTTYGGNTPLKWGPGTKGKEENGSFKIGASAANQYDNILILPLGEIKPREVYVKYVDKDGNTFDIANNQQILNGQLIGTEAVTGQACTDGYQEYYKIKRTDKMTIARSAKLVVNGVEYKYEGYKATTANTYDEAKKMIKSSNNTNIYTKDYVNIGSENSDVTIVEFKYKTINVPTPDPKINISTSPDIETNPGACEIILLPIGSNIYPYATTQAYIPKNIVYELGVSDNGSPTYSHLTFEVSSLDYVKLNNVGGNNNEKLLNGDKDQRCELKNGEVESIVAIARDKYETSFPQSGILPIDNVNRAHFNNTGYNIPMVKYNGIRELKGTAHYDGGEEKTIDVNPKINVYAPVDGLDVDIKTDGFVDHTTNKNNKPVIQKNAITTITPKVASNLDYVKYYLLIFDFDAKIESGSTNKKNGSIVKANEPIQVEKTKSLVIIPQSGAADINDITDKGEDKVAQVSNNIKVIAVTANMDDDRLKSDIVYNGKGYKYKSGMVDISNPLLRVECKDINRNMHNNNIESEGYNTKNMYHDAYYFLEKNRATTNVGRLYDFKITDCSDINFKNVFRKNDGYNVNSLTGTTYLSGSKKLWIYKGLNWIEERENLDIQGTKAKKILPLGPYKNTNVSYVQAPKMGYRISFDLKTSGYYKYDDRGNHSDRTIKITPSYYYLSKDGKTKYDDIKLYYKNSTGKYVNFQNSGYTIYFKPNDGYRNLYNKDDAGKTPWMSKQLEPLKIGNESFELNYKMMTSSDSDFIQAWYGEFKLPNSTIAVGGGTTINNPLKNGYIGVKFDIKCIDKEGVTVSYNENDKGVGTPNTTQWDYEGYLGYNGAGREVSKDDKMELQLEKGIYQIDTNEKYNKFKSTVVLFDLDNRAANDFE
ncbi:MAG: hypothetical protein RSB67_03495 [Clostridia bacterium]